MLFYGLKFTFIVGDFFFSFDVNKSELQLQKKKGVFGAQNRTKKGNARLPEREQINRSVRQLAPETKATKDDDDDDDDDIKRRQKTRAFVFGTRWKGFN